MNGVEAAKQRILARVPLAELIGQHLSLSRRSGRQVGLCPFHAEKSPSFTVYGERYFCFGCKATGDAIDFARHVVGLGFMDALKYLAEKFGVEAPELEQSSHWRSQGDSKAGMYRAMQAAQEFFVASLQSSEGMVARQYLAKRGFSEEEIAQFEFGFAPGTGSLSDRGPAINSRLVAQLTKIGIDRETLLTCSLAFQGRQQLSDFFRGRLMIPIKDAYGRIVAFGGRTLGSDQPKYLNSKEGPLFDKGRLLFGLDRAKGAIRDKRRAIIVEGYLDAIKLWSAGFGEAVACLGTALTAAHLRALEPLTNTAILLFDGDSAGEKASLKAVGVALDVPKVTLRVAELPAGKDPDDYVVEKGAVGLTELLGQSSGILEYAIRETIRGVEKLEIPKVVREQFVPWLSKVEDPLERGFLLSRVAQGTGISLAALEKELADDRTLAAAAEVRKSQVQEPVGEARSLTALEFEVLAHLFFASPSEVSDGAMIASLAKGLRWDEPWRTLFESILNCLKGGANPSQVQPAELLGAAHPRLFDEIEKFRVAEEAFRCNDRPKRLARLARELREREIRSSVALLRKQLTASDLPEQSRPILQAIQELNLELTALASVSVGPEGAGTDRR